jgi:AcrR family transcriptional regulator
VPKLWTDTVEEHRQAVRQATLDATARLVTERGLTSVTMSAVAQEAGIGRATLYKYFPDLDAILAAWHERQVGDHLQQLARVRDQASPAQRLEAVLTAYAQLISHREHDTDVAAALHGGPHVARAHQHLAGLLAALLADEVQAGRVRSDVPPGELAGYCLHALSAATDLPAPSAVGRLVAVTLAGLRFRGSAAGATADRGQPRSFW